MHSWSEFLIQHIIGHVFSSLKTNNRSLFQTELVLMPVIKQMKVSQVLWLTSVILATQEAKIRRIEV
jgi:hypothetical protein